MAYRVLPDDGVMLLHTITALTIPQMAEKGLPLTFSVARFIKFILTEIFPGGTFRRSLWSASGLPHRVSS
jgi:cyclopropane-fatty-acyl-phospholipid synthase